MNKGEFLPMCISSKGAGYNPAEKVKEAVEVAVKMGRSVEQFFICAQKHTLAPFDAEVAARLYKAAGTEYQPLHAVLAFADWVLVKSENEVSNRFTNLLEHKPHGRRRKRANAYAL